MEKHSPMGFTYQEYLALTIFLIHSESNCRIGALLDLTYEEYILIPEHKVKVTFQHETGDTFPSFYRFRPITRAYVKNLHDMFRVETNTEPNWFSPALKTKGSRAMRSI